MSREFRLFFNRFDWRPSSLPSWSGSGHDKFNTSRFVPSGTQRHRWLPLRGKDAYLLANQTPIADSEYDPYGPGWRRWQIAAQQHYSFLEHLENNELWRYKFNIWDFKTKRMGIQLVAMMGKDINAAKPIPKDDEFHFGITMPRKLSRRKSLVLWAFVMGSLTTHSCRCRRSRSGRPLQLPHAAHE